MSELDYLIAEVRRLAVRVGAITLNEADMAAPAAVAPGDGMSADGVRAMLRARRLRDRFFPAELFADPAWDMILDLVAARHEGKTVSVSSLCIASAVPPTTALRWISQLVAAGIVERREHPTDSRSIHILLTDDALAAFHEWHAAVAGRELGA